ncbi:MAG: hypothetical protein IT341_06635 [Chloroflexi bacterium]|nr:hypothetical protein [Chloroflexota bacterium]
MKRTILLLASGMLLASCSSTPGPSLPVRPQVPATWSVTSSTFGDVTIALPPDLKPYAAQSGIRGEWSQASGTALVEVWATAPTAVDQPDDPDHLRPWLEKLGWIPRAGFGGVAAVTDERERNVLLPSGPALEVVVTTDPGEQRELRVVTYGIQTSEGVAVIMMRGAPAVMDQRSEDLRLIAVLAQFAPADTSRTSPPVPSAPPASSP